MDPMSIYIYESRKSACIKRAISCRKSSVMIVWEKYSYLLSPIVANDAGRERERKIFSGDEVRWLLIIQ